LCFQVHHTISGPMPTNGNGAKKKCRPGGLGWEDAGFFLLTLGRAAHHFFLLFFFFFFEK
jgi:hypothetical protein